jgi:hypothetical protein
MVVDIAEHERPRQSGFESSETGRTRAEGINNKIKVIKRMVYDFWDDEYFFSKFERHFPGNTG